MPNTKSTGVFIEETAGGVRTIRPVPTAVSAFVGPALSGPELTPITVLGWGDFERRFGGLSRDSAMSYAVQQFFLNGGSEALVVRVPPATATALEGTALIEGVEALRPAEPFNLLCLPDAVLARPADPDTPARPDYRDIYRAGCTLCEDKAAFLIVDTPPDVQDAHEAAAWMTTGFGLSSANAAAYFPWLSIDDPLAPGSRRSCPPSGAIAGIVARTDDSRGVWKAPAGTAATVAGVQGPVVAMTDAEQALLNPIGLNGIRAFPAHGTVVYGARTLLGADDLASEWKYVPVRRTALFISESLRQGLAWVTFEPNEERTWAAIRLTVGAFMQNLFRQGVFQGRSPSQAYFVKCDAETTSRSDIDNGIVTVVVGFAPLRPAEFVIVTVRQLAGQTGDPPSP